ncbi:MAG: SurA N-terminal domain-containing protein [Ardenticatenaceae bacterium]|nr:SurA N-terminal domain-containing protein [Anaerolineales bacterium]MCB8920971.1 SurA N-terminal domain-containing protein [Ardenticatenaceae bacterium]MCB8991604.1 SurA N-terminal domain-containing protein [Ardenticatenaceae bacterium]MCB9004233.1 SurA N-terminal domain-containing protein [Ardenticatenaceae bacterium]
MFSRHKVTLQHRSRWFVTLFLLFLILVGLTACKDDNPVTTNEAQPTAVSDSSPAVTVPSPDPTALPATATAVPPTPTVEPLAALVNDEPIYLADYEKELARYEQAHLELGQDPTGNYRATVLDALIDRALITQAAAKDGVVITPEMVDAKLDELRAAASGENNYTAWLEANQWTEEEFRQALATEMVTAQMRDRVTADVPQAVEQVHARYLQVDDAALAANLLAQIRAGSDFSVLAQQYSRDTTTAPSGGDLGFFPQGALLVPEIEAVAMMLQPGETSDVITVAGADGSENFYLVQVIERDAQRPLDATMRYNLLTQAFDSWLNTQRDQAAITRFVDTDA